MRLVLIRGLPGSGKSTFAEKAFPGVFRVENDMFHMKNGRYAWSASRMPDAITWCMDMCDAALGNGMDVVVANTFTKKKFVEAYRRLAERHGAEFVVYRMTGDHGNVHNVPETVLKSMKAGFEDWPGEKKV